eukprot:3440059-Rhodomonas_salina.1
MQDVHTRTGTVWIGFGDSVLALNLYVQLMLKGAARRSVRGQRFNRRMASVRISVENAFAEVLNRWQYIGVRLLQKLGSSMPVGQHNVVGFFMHNCYGILYGMQASVMFGNDLRA